MNSAGNKVDPALETVITFLESVKNVDSSSFWGTLDKRGQGYFLGLWFYAMDTMNIQTILKLTQEKEFMDGVLGPIINALKDSIGEMLDNPVYGDIVFSSPHHASIRVTSAGQQSEVDEDDWIPLVLELSDTENSDANLTCWKIDTLKCFQLNKGMH